MKVDRAKAIAKQFDGETFYFCSTHCLHAFEVDRGASIGRRESSDDPSNQASARAGDGAGEPVRN